MGSRPDGLAQKGALAMFTTTTTQSVKFHGWTLPAGSVVTVREVRVDMYSLMEHYTSASCTTDAVGHEIGIPTSSLAARYTELQSVPWHTEHLY
tara:strand:+ start:103 stop:384 length:282 start_codon:yes stop_codon:yes gene_type:complete